MRVGIDARPLGRNRAGIGTYVYNVVKALNEQDDNNEYYLFSSREIILDFELKDNWHIVVDEFKVGTLWLYARGNSLIKKYGIDVFWGTQSVLPAVKHKNTRYVLTICDLAQFRISNIGETYNSIIQKVFVKGSCRRADRILAISNATKNDIVDLFKIPASRIECIYLGGVPKGENVNDETISSVKAKWNLDSEYFLFVSTIEPRKNVDTIVSAFELFMDNSEKDYKLVLAGGLGWKYEPILDKINKSKYKDRIILTGFVSAEEKSALYIGAAAFLYPSLYEGFGIPVLEAMNYDLPIVTSNISSLPEVGGDAVMYLNNVKDAVELAGLMEKSVCLSSKEREEIARKSEIQRKKFSWDKCAGEIVSELIGKAEIPTKHI